METNGLTGKMRFDNTTGNRNYFKVDVVKVHESKKHHLGSWDPIQGMTLTRSISEMNSEFEKSISNKTFIVVGKLVSARKMQSIRWPKDSGTYVSKINRLRISSEYQLR